MNFGLIGAAGFVAPRHMQAIKETDNVQVVVYNLTGAVVTVLADEQLNSGKHSIKWSTSELPAGYYFCNIRTSTSSVMHKMSKVR